MKKIHLLAAAMLLVFLVTSIGAFYKTGNLRKGIGLRDPLDPPSQEGVSKEYWKVAPDIQLYRFSVGSGTPVLVIHGGPGFPPAETWKGVEPLSDRFQFYFYHQRGCGLSTKPFDRFESDNYMQNMVQLDKTLGLTEQLADIERIRRILKTDKLILFGHSFGGFLASLYAREFPEHVDKMVLIAPAGMLRMPVEDSGFEALKDLLPKDKQKEYEDYLARYLEFKTIFTRDETYLSSVSLEFVEYFKQAYKAQGLKFPAGSESPVEWAGGWMVFAMYFSMGMKYDLRPEIAKIEVPVLLLHGEKDVFSVGSTREYESLLPQGEMKIIPQAAHFPFLEMPAEFSNMIKAYLKDK